MSEIRVLYPQNQEFIEAQRELLRDTVHRLNMGEIVCQNKIGEEFVQQAISGAHIIVVNIFREKIIGFAAVMRYMDENERTYLYIELICNSPQPGIETRAGAAAVAVAPRVGAKVMINVIEELAKTEKHSYVKLNAVAAVIPYYYHLGYYFTNLFIEKTGELNEHMKKSADELIHNLRTAQENKNEGEQETQLRAIITHYYPGYFSEKYQGKVADTQDPAARMIPAKNEGIPMIKMMVERGTAGHGGKKHKRKTIRKKYSRNKQRVMLKKSRKYRRRV